MGTLKTGRYADLARAALNVDWQKNIFRMMSFLQLMYIFFTFFPNLSTIATLAQQQFHISNYLLSGFFFYGFGQFVWGLKPRQLLLAGFTGQIIYCTLAFIFFLQNLVPLTSVVCHFALLFISMCLVLRYSDEKGKLAAKKLTPMVVSLAMFFYGIGIMQQPEMGFALWSQHEWFITGNTILGFIFFFAGGYILHNHAQPSTFFLSLVPQMFYATYCTVYYFSATNVPVFRPIIHIVLSFYLIILTAARVQERD